MHEARNLPCVLCMQGVIVVSNCKAGFPENRPHLAFAQKKESGLRLVFNIFHMKSMDKPELASVGSSQ
ncbi:hypothetical protein V8Z74_17230 [Comamonas sp. w2-DMI]|uniref:hypothetical protein n=1 Tax=Comamonas sp. w2-DMI TaxID=3126391 RepID=UPI0032E47B72